MYFSSSSSQSRDPLMTPEINLTDHLMMEMNCSARNFFFCFLPVKYCRLSLLQTTAHHSSESLETCHWRTLFQKVRRHNSCESLLCVTVAKSHLVYLSHVGLFDFFLPRKINPTRGFVESPSVSRCTWRNLHLLLKQPLHNPTEW